MRLLPETWQKSLQEMRAPRCKYSKPQKGQAYTDYCAQYCSEECQKDHWYKIHKADCNSAIAKPPWEPDWVAERRKPACSGDRVASYALFGSKKYLRGNLPAIDILQLRANEGLRYSKPLNLLFAGRFISTEM